MSVKIQNNIETDRDWNAEFNVFGTGDMCFSFEGKTILKSDGIELGMLKEINGIEKICRSHYSAKTKWSWVETETFHPFGSEPVVKRKWEQAANHIKVVSDIIIRATTPMDHISIDSLILPGKWDKVLIFSQLNPESTEISIEEFDLSNYIGKEKQFDFLPLVMLFVAEDGTELEIGAGYDLWRWHDLISGFGGKAEFVLKGTNEGLFLDRKIFFSDEDYEMPRNNFRFSWYFAWGNSMEMKPSVNINSCSLLTPLGNKLVSMQKELQDTENINGVADIIGNHAYCLDNSKWPLTAVIEGNQNIGKPILNTRGDMFKLNSGSAVYSNKRDSSECIFPCFCSRQSGNFLKSWFRSQFNISRDLNSDVYLCDIDVHICTNASHLIRGKRKNFIHWDYFYLLSFWEWANKYLGDTDIYFHIIFSKDSPFADLPSVKGLSVGKTCTVH